MQLDPIEVIVCMFKYYKYNCSKTTKKPVIAQQLFQKLRWAGGGGGEGPEGGGGGGGGESKMALIAAHLNAEVIPVVTV